MYLCIGFVILAELWSLVCSILKAAFSVMVTEHPIDNKRTIKASFTSSYVVWGFLCQNASAVKPPVNKASDELKEQKNSSCSMIMLHNKLSYNSVA